MARPSRDAQLEDIEGYRHRIVSQPLAQGLDLLEVREFLSHLPERRFPHLAYAARGAFPCIQPRGGFPRFETQLRLTRQLDEAGADFIPLTIDSYTRHNQYDTAAQLLQRSEDEDKDYLNGYPLINHGFELSRELYQGINKPISLRHGTPDARLLVEVAIASGIVEIEGGGICYCVPYSEGFPLDRSLLYWQYVDRICALYSTPERPIHRESFGPLSATMVPPAVAIAVQIIEALLSAEQGVLSFAVSFGQTGSMIQDIATARVLRTLAREYLDAFDFKATQLYLVYHQWMGQFPIERPKAAALISGSTLISSIIGADKIVVKTVDEALGVPAAEVNAEAVETVRYLLRTFRCSEPVSSPEIEREAELLESETRTLMQAIFDLPGEVFWESVFSAFRMGYLDIPFSPHADSANRLLSMRDANASIRIVDPGAMPILAQDAALELELVASHTHRADQSYRQLLADINLMMR